MPGRRPHSHASTLPRQNAPRAQEDEANLRIRARECARKRALVKKLRDSTRMIENTESSMMAAEASGDVRVAVRLAATAMAAAVGDGPADWNADALALQREMHAASEFGAAMDDALDDEGTEQVEFDELTNMFMQEAQLQLMTELPALPRDMVRESDIAIENDVTARIDNLMNVSTRRHL